MLWTENLAHMLSRHTYLFGIATGMLLSFIYLQPIKNLNSVMPNIKNALNNVNTNLEQMNVKPDAFDLLDEVRILCLVLTKPENHKTRARSVKETWGSRCNKLLFVSSISDDELEIVTVNVTEDRKYLWGKTRKGFQYVYDYHLNGYDWFLKADDDTYIIMENLRYLLYQYSSNFPIYFGARFRHFTAQGSVSGGAGYVLSRKALTLFVEKGLSSYKLCKNSDIGTEDVTMSICLNNIGIIAGDDRDENGRKRFFPMKAETILNSKFDENWYRRYTLYPLTHGFNCCSDTAISFHYIAYKQMYTYEYFLYHLRRFGLKQNTLVLPKRMDWTNVIEKHNSDLNLVALYNIKGKRKLETRKSSLDGAT